MGELQPAFHKAKRRYGTTVGAAAGDSTMRRRRAGRGDDAAQASGGAAVLPDCGRLYLSMLKAPACLPSTIPFLTCLAGWYATLALPGLLFLPFTSPCGAHGASRLYLQGRTSRASVHLLTRGQAPATRRTVEHGHGGHLVITLH